MTKSEDHHAAQPGLALVIESGGSRHGGGAGRASEARRRSRLRSIADRGLHRRLASSWRG